MIGPASAGSESPARDAEVLEMLATLLDRLGITDWNLELNSVGTPADRAQFNEALRKALEPVAAQMCDDCQRRAVTNPLRVFDCKVPQDQPIIETLPRITQFLGEDSRKHFEAVQEILRRVGVEFTYKRPPGARARLLHAHGIRVHARRAGRAECDPRRRALRRTVGSARRSGCSGNRLCHWRRPVGDVVEGDGREACCASPMCTSLPWPG